MIYGPITKLIMTHDNKTRGKKTDGNVENISNPLAKLVENIINHINTSVNTLRYEFLNLK